MSSKCRFLPVLLAAACGLAQAPAVSQIADRLTANGLLADVSFLASDALEGRGTPSRGLDLAAEYIAAQFRRAGLEPAGDDGYFQTAAFDRITPDASGFDLALEIEGRTIHAQSSAVKLRNVAGVMRGSDPALEETYLLVTAHYDHLGTDGGGPGDRIFNGANDDASGTASVIAIADALASLPRRPRRSIVFLAFFGEELGEVGSRYYVRHPIFPLAKTAADINLEQLGRTDDSDGPHIGTINLTGFDFTDMPGAFRKAAKEAGVRLVKNEEKDDRYFMASDNFPFANSGVPSTTVSVAYEFPDYHQPGDEWPKLDYRNMAKVDRAVALAVYAIADSVAEPQWNVANPQAQRFAKARQNH